MARLFIMRHGTAQSGRGVPDAERQLTSEGEAALNEAAAGLKHGGVTFDIILASAFKRTHQSAEIMQRGLALTDEPIVCPTLICGALPEALHKEILRYHPKQSVLVVGHMPDVMGFVTGFTQAHRQIVFAPGTMVCIDFQNDQMEHWMHAGRLLWTQSVEELSGFSPP